MAAIASMVLLASWSLPTANGEFLTLLEDAPPYVGWSPPPSEPWVPPPQPQQPQPQQPQPQPPHQTWSADDMTEEGTCYFITVSPVPGGGMEYGGDGPDDHASSCRHDDDGDDPKSQW